MEKEEKERNEEEGGSKIDGRAQIGQLSDLLTLETFSFSVFNFSSSIA